MGVLATRLDPHCYSDKKTRLFAEVEWCENEIDHKPLCSWEPLGFCDSALAGKGPVLEFAKGLL